MFGLGKKITYASFPNLDPDHLTEHDVVGESKYFDNLRTMANTPTPDSEYKWVALVAEPKNPFDRNAICVLWVNPSSGGVLTCGYIPREMTSQWHPVVASAPKGTIWVFPAKVIGGQDDRYYGLVFFS